MHGSLRGLPLYVKKQTNKQTKTGALCKLTELDVQRGVPQYMTCIGMCCCERYGFQAVWSGIGYRSQGVLV